MKYFSMFSGIGGFELGIQQAYESNNLRLQRGEEQRQDDDSDSHGRDSESLKSQSWGDGNPICIGYSEIDKYAIQIYERHFNHKNYGDATRIDPADLPDFDLLVGGFPCQAFSIAGKRMGFDDTRGTLFFDIARIVKEKQPRHLLLENVKGLLSHDSGRTFTTIISTLTELGYDTEWQVLNSKNFGVPQNRERVFIIGHLGRCCGRQVFPLGEGSQRDNPSLKVGTLRGDEDTQVATTLKSRDYKGGGNLISKTVRSGGRASPHGSKQNWDSYEYEGRIRRLTPTECERLQAYPDGWTEGVSDTQRYKTLGNSVTVSVIKEIIKRLYGIK